jgi:site-specific recombinase XerD
MNTLITIDQTEATIVKRLLAGKLTKNTRQAYAKDLENFGTFLKVDLESIPDSAWLDFDKSTVATYLEWLKQQVSDKTGRPYSPATIARRMTAVKELLTEATYHGCFGRDDLDYIKNRLESVEVTNEHHAGITAAEQDQLLSLADSQPGLKGLRDYALFRLWLDTGLRRAEMAGLKVRDLTVKAGIDTLIVRQGKGGKLREIGLESDTADLVREWLFMSGQAREAQADNPIFCQVRKAGRGNEATYQTVNPEKHISPVNLYQLVLWYVRQAGIKSKITPHSFRVAMITDMLDYNAPIQHVQKVTGHSTTRMITEVYDRNTYNKPIASYRGRKLPSRVALRGQA